MSNLEEQFKALGDATLPDDGGLAFAITLKSINDDFGGDKQKPIAAFPRPDYEHRIYLDEFTDNFIVERPNRAGQYWSWPNKMKRIR